MKTSLKILVAALAGTAAFSAGATHDSYPNRYERSPSYTYDRYGNAYDQYGNRVDPRAIERQYRAERWRDAPRYDPRYREYRYETPKQFEHRMELEAAQRGELDSSVTPHPLSPNYSGG